jgi:hypothetical protein
MSRYGLRRPLGDTRRRPLDHRADGRDLDGAFEGRLRAVERLHGGSAGRQTGAGGANDVRLHDNIVRAPDQEQVLDVVAPQEDQLSLPVEIVDVHNPEPGLARPPPVARERHAAARQPSQDQSEQREQHEDDGEGDHILGRLGQVLEARDGELQDATLLGDAGPRPMALPAGYPGWHEIVPR